LIKQIAILSFIFKIFVSKNISIPKLVGLKREMKINLNKIFRYLSIKTKLLIAFIGLSVIPLSIFGIYGAYLNIKNLNQIIFENISHDVELIQKNLENFINEVKKDIFFLRSSHVLRSYLLKPDPWSQGELAKEILSFVQIKGIYYQIKVLDASGSEIFKILKVNGNYVFIREDEFETQGGTYYKLLIGNLKPDQISFAPAELLSPDDEIVPVITCAAPIYIDGKFAAILVADVFAREVFKVIEDNPHHYAGKTIILNEQGYYLYHSERKKEWNRLLATREVDNFLTNYSGKVYSEIILGSKKLLHYGDQIIYSAPLFSKLSPLSNRYIILRVVKRDLVFKPVYNFSIFFVIIFIFFLTISSILAIIAAGQITKPINELKKGAQIVASGNYDFRLKIETNDELEELANEFNTMAQMLSQHEKEIEMHRNHLEELVAQRTKELIEEKQKLQSILDNVPSAFLLIDESRKIVTASSAVRFLINHMKPEDVVGTYCRESFKNYDFCEGCDFEKVLKTGRSSVRLIKEKDRYFEIFMIPVQRESGDTFVLEVITDVTERKKAEENLIKSEKLAFVWEMASVIAHEIRNSITSIKMILQLYLESETLSNESRESFTVAMSSILRMENIVNQLLQFSKPTPPRFEPINVNSILELAVEFVKIQFKKKNIKLVKNYDKNIPQIYADANSLKEAFINILINAFQAIDKAGVIEIRTKREVLNADMFEKMNWKDFEPKFALGEDVVHIIISDTGCGIPPEDMDKIFEPFFTTKAEGTGLGLSIVKRVVTNHGGVIDVESEVGSGTKFHIYLPVNNLITNLDEKDAWAS